MNSGKTIYIQDVIYTPKSSLLRSFSLLIWGLKSRLRFCGKAKQCLVLHRQRNLKSKLQKTFTCLCLNQPDALLSVWVGRGSVWFFMSFFVTVLMFAHLHISVHVYCICGDNIQWGINPLLWLLVLSCLVVLHSTPQIVVCIQTVIGHTTLIGLLKCKISPKEISCFTNLHLSRGSRIGDLNKTIRIFCFVNKNINARLLSQEEKRV